MGFWTDCDTDFSNSTASAFGQLLVEELILSHGLRHTRWHVIANWAPPMHEKDWRTPNELGRVVEEHLEANVQRRSG